MQAAVSVHSLHPLPRLPRNRPVCCWITSFAAYGAGLTMHYHGDDAAVLPFLSLVTLTFDL